MGQLSDQPKTPVFARIGPTGRAPIGPQAVVVGAHWTVSAQIHAALGPEIPVGSLSADSDFSRWLPKERWTRARFVLFVTDDRFSVDAARAFPEHDAVSVDTARVYRGGRVVRTIRVVRLERAAVAGR